MEYLLWALLNFTVAVAILYGIYRLIKAVYLKFGIPGAILIILIVSAITIRLTHREVREIQTWDFKTTSEVKYFQQDYNISLMKNSIFDIGLRLMSLSDKDRHAQEPLKSFCTFTGLVGYNEWTPENITISTKPEVFDYMVEGRLEWRLLSFTVYTEHKNFTGSIRKT